MEVWRVWALSAWLTPRLSRAVSRAWLSRGARSTRDPFRRHRRGPAPQIQTVGPLVGRSRRQEKRERRRLDARHSLGDQHQPIRVFVLFNRRSRCWGHGHLERSGVRIRPLPRRAVTMRQESLRPASVVDRSLFLSRYLSSVPKDLQSEKIDRRPAWLPATANRSPLHGRRDRN